MIPETICVPLISQKEIEAGVKRLAAEINRDYRGKNPLLIGILKGCFVFMADLARQIEVPVEIDFVRLASYGSGKETSGQVKVISGPRSAIKGRDVIIVEDIIDTGLSVDHFFKFLQKKHPASLKLCALVEKPARRRVPVHIDYLGFTVPDKFLVGCGLDWDEKYRNLPDICALEEKWPDR
jgi:hypoxanthine phosphoribosyltransferase